MTSRHFNRSWKLLINIKNKSMKSRLVTSFALVATGMLAGVFYYGTFTVIPAFFEVPVDVHLKYRVALMNHNAVYVQLLTAFAILAPGLLALAGRHVRRIKNFAILAAVSALISILITRFGNVPINRMMRIWEAGTVPKNWREILERWNMFNNIRTFFALASFGLTLVAAQIGYVDKKMPLASHPPIIS
jgi:uncharacterized membrane protein